MTNTPPKVSSNKVLLTLSSISKWNFPQPSTSLSCQVSISSRKNNASYISERQKSSEKEYSNTSHLAPSESKKWYLKQII
jgi:hypothetical protein